MTGLEAAFAGLTIVVILVLPTLLVVWSVWDWLRPKGEGGAPGASGSDAGDLSGAVRRVSGARLSILAVVFAIGIATVWAWRLQRQADGRIMALAHRYDNLGAVPAHELRELEALVSPIGTPAVEVRKRLQKAIAMRRSQAEKARRARVSDQRKTLLSELESLVTTASTPRDLAPAVKVSFGARFPELAKEIDGLVDSAFLDRDIKIEKRVKERAKELFLGRPTGSPISEAEKRELEELAGPLSDRLGEFVRKARNLAEHERRQAKLEAERVTRLAEDERIAGKMPHLLEVLPAIRDILYRSAHDPESLRDLIAISDLEFQPALGAYVVKVQYRARTPMGGLRLHQALFTVKHGEVRFLRAW